METPAAEPIQNAAEMPDHGGILRQSWRLYRSHFRVFLWSFVTPAAAHCLWILLQRTINHLRHPGWPQEGILFAPDLGSSIYALTLELTCIGALVYLFFAGPAIAAAAAAIASLCGRGSTQTAPATPRRPRLRFAMVQMAAAFLAWWPFLAALGGSIAVSFTILLSRSEAALDLWYLLLAIAFFAGVPAGAWMSVRYALAVPAMFSESLGTSAAIKRSLQLTKGIRLRIAGVFFVVAGLRWILGFTANVSLGAFARTHPAAATTEAFVLIPLLAFALDLLIGPLFGIPIALFYRRQARAPAAGG